MYNIEKVIKCNNKKISICYLMCLVLYNNINLKKNYVNYVGFVKSMSDLKFLYLLIIWKEEKK